MASDAKFARTIAASIAQVGSALRQSPLPSAKATKDGCAAAIRTAKEAADQISEKHRSHARLLIGPLKTGCLLFVKGDIAGAQRAITLALEGAQALEQEIAPIKPATLRGDSIMGMEGLDYLGEDQGNGGGDIYSSIIKAVGGIAQGGLNYAKNKKDAEASAAEINAKVQAAVAADKAATSALTAALVSEFIAKTNPGHKSVAEADRAAAEAAAVTQDVAGAAVPEAGRAARTEAALAAVNAAVAKVGSTTAGDKKVAQLNLQAAQRTLEKARAQSAAATSETALSLSSSQSSESGDFLSIFTTKFGPLPRYAYALIAGGAFVGYKVLTKKKKG